jgi:cellobiose phosphorylase
LFIVRHYLGVRFEGETLVVRPAVYPGSPPVQADLRFRDARLHLTIDSHGRLRAARVNDQPVKPDRTGTLRWTPPKGVSPHY